MLQEENSRSACLSWKPINLCNLPPRAAACRRSIFCWNFEVEMPVCDLISLKNISFILVCQFNKSKKISSFLLMRLNTNNNNNNVRQQQNNDNLYFLPLLIYCAEWENLFTNISASFVPNAVRVCAQLLADRHLRDLCLFVC